MRPLCVFILYFLCISSVPGNRPLVYKSTNLECIGDPKYAVNVSCLVKALNWNKAVTNMECDLILPLRNTTIQMEVFKKNYNNRYHPFLVNVAFNICDVISKRNFTPYGTILWKLLKDYTNVNHSCPITGHLMARNLYVDANNSLIPKPPLGFYMISLRVMENFSNRPGENVGLIKFYAQVTEMVETKKKRN